MFVVTSHDQALRRWPIWKPIRGSLQLWRQPLHCWRDRCDTFCLCAQCSNVSGKLLHYNKWSTISANVFFLLYFFFFHTKWEMAELQAAEAVLCLGLQGAPVFLLVCRAAVCFTWKGWGQAWDLIFLYLLYVYFQGAEENPGDRLKKGDYAFSLTLHAPRCNSESTSCP